MLLKKLLQGVLAIVVIFVFLLVLITCSVTPMDCMKHYHCQTAMYTVLGTIAVICSWTVAQFCGGHRIFVGLGVLMQICLVPNLVENGYRYFRSYGVCSSVCGDLNFPAVCAVAKDAVDSVAGGTECRLLSVDMWSYKHRCGLYGFTACGIDGDVWSGRGGRFEWDEVKWTIWRNHDDTLTCPTNSIENVYAEFLENDPAINTKTHLTIRWNPTTESWEKDEFESWAKDELKL